MPQDDDKPTEERQLPPAQTGPDATTTVADHGAKTGDSKNPWSLSQLREQGRRKEDVDLSALVTTWVQNTWPGDDVKLKFIETELDAELRSWRVKARWWRTAQISIWLLLAILGLLISVFAGFKTGQGFTIIAGALVATLTTLTNAARPSKQADGYRTARFALRDEGWSLLNRSGDYAKLTNEHCYDQFAKAVHKIVLAKRTATSLDSLAP